MDAALYRPGVGRYLDEDRRWYVVEDAEGYAFRLFAAGSDIAEGTVRRAKGGDLVVGNPRGAVVEEAISLSPGRVGEWLVGPATGFTSLVTKGQCKPPPLPAVPDTPVAELSGLSKVMVNRVLREYIIARGSRRRLLFATVDEADKIHWHTLSSLPHPSDEFRKLVAGPERKAVESHLLRAARIRLADAPLHPHVAGERVALVHNRWYRILPDDSQLFVANEGGVVVFDVPAFSRSVVPFGWRLRTICGPAGALKAGDPAHFPVEGYDEGCVLVPWTEDRTHHLVLAINTLRSRGVGGLSLTRTANGRAQSTGYSGPDQPEYFMYDDGSVLVIPS
jgi:hypothetical protein